jgi:dTDP-4-dehydrorhamnose 3,5-epimerase-like enzyme
MAQFNDFNYINFPVVEDTRGNLAFIQNDVLPFEFKRIYYLFDVPSNAFRGGHSHIDQQEILIVLDNGAEKTIVLLNKPNIGLHIGTGIWRELQNFSSGAVCLVVASDVFDESDYIRDYGLFLKEKQIS